jgi:hypothetical protein
MAALTQNRLTIQSGVSGVLAQRVSAPVADNVHIYTGALVQADGNGNATPAGTATQADTHLFRTLGVAEAEADNTVAGHTAGGITVTVRQGVFLFDIGTAGDALTQADVGNTVYAIDDHTVGKTSNTTTRASAGRLLGIDAASGMAIVQTVVGLT